MPWRIGGEYREEGQDFCNIPSERGSRKLHPEDREQLTQRLAFFDQGAPVTACLGKHQYVLQEVECGLSVPQRLVGQRRDQAERQPVPAATVCFRVLQPASQQG